MHVAALMQGLKRMQCVCVDGDAVLLRYHDESWLIQKLCEWVGDNRNSVTAGRTSTRLNTGRPQTRWQCVFC